MILQKTTKRRIFDVDSEQDIHVYVEFLKSGAWGITGCPFELQYPYTTVPDMIKDKLIHKFLKVWKRI